MRGSQARHAGTLVLFVITGAVIGGILGEVIGSSPLFAGMAPYLTRNYAVLDVPPLTVNLYVIRFVVGFSIYPNLVSLAGMIAAFFLYRRF